MFFAFCLCQSCLWEQTPISCFIPQFWTEIRWYSIIDFLWCYVLSCLRAKVVGKFLEKLSKSNKSRRAFQVILCLAETAALGIMATWANTVLESQSVSYSQNTLLTEHFSRDNRYIYLCENRTKGKLAWADVVCAKAVILDLSIHDYVCCLSTYIIICCYYCFFILSVILILEK